MERRHIRLDGSLNLRDLGGYEVTRRQVVRTGCVFRSDELHALTDADLEVVTTLGVKVVFDLRNHDERARRPSRLPPDVELLERASPSIEGDGRTIEDQIIGGDLPIADDDYFAGVYIRLLDCLGPELSVILQRAVESPQRPLLFHCAAGKDRTGIVAAVLLGLLGASDDTILDDYELTSAHYTPGRLQAMAALMAEHQVTEDRVRPLLEARRSVLAAALQHLHGTYGGYDAFATDQLGLGADLPARLRAALLVPQ